MANEKTFSPPHPSPSVAELRTTDRKFDHLLVLLPLEFEQIITLKDITLKLQQMAALSL